MNNRDEVRRRYLMNRRAFLGMAAAGAASPLLARAATAQPAPKARNVVLVHGLFADGSCWSEVSFGSITTEIGFPRHVRFPQDSDQTADIAGGPVRAKS